MGLSVLKEIIAKVVPGVEATNLGKAEDAAHASGDTGVMLLAVRKDTAAILAGTDGDYVPVIVDANGRLHVLDQNSAAIKTAVELIDDTVLAEDAVHATGDKGMMMLAVRKDAAAILAGTDGDYTPLIVDAYGRLHIASLASVVHTEYPFAKGDLTSDGVQETEVDTTTADTDIAIETVTIEPPAAGSIVEVEFGLTASFRAVTSATADIIWKWQARDKDGTWVDLHSAVTEADIGTTYVERTRSGRFATVADFDAVPFDIRLIIQCNELNEGRAKIKNSSYVKVKYNPA
jgi:hypothetical protein